MPIVNGKEYSYDKKGMAAAKKARAQIKNMKNSDSNAKSKPSGKAMLDSLPNKKNMPARVGEAPKMRSMPYKGGDYKKQLLKAKLASLSKKKK